MTSNFSYRTSQITTLTQSFDSVRNRVESFVLYLIHIAIVFEISSSFWDIRVFGHITQIYLIRYCSNNYTSLISWNFYVPSLFLHLQSQSFISLFSCILLVTFLFLQLLRWIDFSDTFWGLNERIQASNDIRARGG